MLNYICFPRETANVMLLDLENLWKPFVYSGVSCGQCVLARKGKKCGCSLGVKEGKRREREREKEGREKDTLVHCLSPSL